jgi:hypothetical protein
VVAVLTGHLLKDADSARRGREVVEIEPRLRDLEAVLARIEHGP